MVMTYEISNYLDKDTAIKAREVAESLEDPRWIRRSQLTPPRQIEKSSCSYDFCGHRQMPTHVVDFLKSIAPHFDEHRLAEVAINRYNVGDYLGKHRDFDYYRKNLVIALQDSDDGVLIDEDNSFVKDSIGQGICINGIGPVHSVSPVNNKRYSLVYLYE
jgi:hypothetical protein